MQKNVTDKSPRQIDYIDVSQKPFSMNVGETAADPTGWYLDGTTIYFVPTPSAAATSYARCWMIVPEGATMASGGPAYIPRIAHKLIVFYAAILIGMMNEYDIRALVGMYEKMLDKVVGVVGYKIQQQPRFLKESVFEKSTVSTLDPALRDWRGDHFFR